MKTFGSKTLPGMAAVLLLVSGAATVGPGAMAADDAAALHVVSVVADAERESGRGKKRQGPEFRPLYAFTGGIAFSPQLHTDIICSNAGRRGGKVKVVLTGQVQDVVGLAPAAERGAEGNESAGGISVFRGTAFVPPFATRIFGTDVSDFHFVNVDLGADGLILPLSGVIKSNRKDVVCTAHVVANQVLPTDASDLQLERIDG